ncbi:MAG: metal-dependent hydrolase [Candidatus Micrarchaeia archaeon]
MNWRAHLFIGTAFGAVAAYLLQLNLPSAIFFCAISAVSSLLPDLDIRNSKASQATYAAALLAVLAAAYFLSFAKGRGPQEFAIAFLAIAGALLVLDLLFRPRHRGVMHSAPFALAAAAAAFLVFGALAALAFFLGYFSHLVADGGAIFNK